MNFILYYSQIAVEIILSTQSKKVQMQDIHILRRIT